MPVTGKQHEDANELTANEKLVDRRGTQRGTELLALLTGFACASNSLIQLKVLVHPGGLEPPAF